MRRFNESINQETKKTLNTLYDVILNQIRYKESEGVSEDEIKGMVNVLNIIQDLMDQK